MNDWAQLVVNTCHPPYMSAASYKRQGRWGECLDPWSINIKMSTIDIDLPRMNNLSEIKAKLQTFRGIHFAWIPDILYPVNNSVDFTLKREISSSRLLVGCQPSRKSFQTPGGWERWDNRSSFLWRYAEKNLIDGGFEKIRAFGPIKLFW